MMYRELNERKLARLFCLADAMVDDNPMRLYPTIVSGHAEMVALHAQLRGLMTEPIAYLEQVYNLLRDNNLLHLIHEE